MESVRVRPDCNLCLARPVGLSERELLYSEVTLSGTGDMSENISNWVDRTLLHPEEEAEMKVCGGDVF